MVAQVQTVTLNGIDAHTVTVQVQISSGMNAFNIVGLPDNAVKESRERVRGAFSSLGISLPAKRITINLSPANLPKEGSHFDLPIAVGLLIALGGLPSDSADNTLFMGELGLDGALHPAQGSLPAAIHARSENMATAYLPKGSAEEAAWADGLQIYSLPSLKTLIDHLEGREVLSPVSPQAHSLPTTKPFSADFKDIKGQESVKRAALIAAAGGHNILMIGPPGSGKSMIASRMTGLLPALEAEEALDVSMVHSIAGQMGGQSLITHRPFRDPHHSASAVALCGGGIKAQPGEMSLAHRGVLFLDELPEFTRNVLETLRQPMETGTITVSRANRHITYPARFQLIAAMNPCPCGYLGHPKTRCSCSPRQVQNYRAKLSGPLLDRIDIHVDVPAVDLKDLSLPAAKEGTSELSAKVEKVRMIQLKRFSDSDIKYNSEMTTSQIDHHSALDDEGQSLLEKAADKFGMSARSYHRILKVARTIADLDGSESVERSHLAESLAYRYIPYQG